MQVFATFIFFLFLRERTALISCSYVGCNNFQCDVAYVIVWRHGIQFSLDIGLFYALYGSRESGYLQK